MSTVIRVAGGLVFGWTASSYGMGIDTWGFWVSMLCIGAIMLSDMIEEMQ